MVAAPFIAGILGFRKAVPNNADVDSVTSCRIASELLSLLGVKRVVPPKYDAGTALEIGVRDYLAVQLPMLDSSRLWLVRRKTLITDFEQYEHLARIDRLVRADPTLRAELGRDYLIKPDVTVGVDVTPGKPPVLHAAVSCKWTMRSDRVQGIRHEGVILTRNRRGRQPHIVTVTAEPLPTRLAAIARGTGEVDAVYHVALEELVIATSRAGTSEQKSVLAELTAQKRLVDFSALEDVLTTT